MRSVFMALAALSLTGCFTTRVYVEGKRPLVTEPEKPTIGRVVAPSELFNEDGTVKEGADVQGSYIVVYNNMTKLLGYAVSLRRVVKTYNEQALSHNVKNGYTDVPE